MESKPTTTRLTSSARMPTEHYQHWIDATAPHALLMNVTRNEGWTRRATIRRLVHLGLVPRQPKKVRVMPPERPTP